MFDDTGSISTLDDLLEYIRSHKIIVYGNGFVARKFYYSLKSYGLQDQVDFFVTTYGGNTFFSKEVKSLKSLANCKDRKLICIAVHEAVRDEIISELNKENISTYLWIYPFFLESYSGVLTAKQKWVPLKILIQCYIDGYAIPIRLLAIEQYFGKNNSGFDIYLKGEAFHCSYDTAKKRLSKFIELIECWNTKGYDSNTPIRITQDYGIIDGVHRTSLAYYHQLPEICCDVYDMPEFWLFSTEDVRLSKRVIDKIGFTEEEREELNRCRSKLEIFASN